MSPTPRHRPRATSSDVVATPRRRRLPSVWLLAAAILGIAAALANAFPDDVSRAWQVVRAWAQPAPAPPAAPVGPPSTADVVAPAVVAAPAAAPVAPVPAPTRRRDYDPNAPMTVIRAIPPPTASEPKARQRPAPAGAPKPAAAPARPAQPSPRAAMVAALRDGSIRPATAYELKAWKARNGQAGKSFDERTRYREAYVITREFTIPDGLTGSNSVIFILQRGAPYPDGNPIHSPVLDMDTGACMGAGACDFLLRED